MKSQNATNILFERTKTNLRKLGSSSSSSSWARMIKVKQPKHREREREREREAKMVDRILRIVI